MFISKQELSDLRSNELYQDRQIEKLYARIVKLESLFDYSMKSKISHDGGMLVSVSATLKKDVLPKK